MKELRLQSGQPGSDFRLAVAVDGVNALWGRSTIRKEDKSAVRKHVHIPVIPHCCLPTQFSGAYMYFYSIVIRWIQRSSLWFITWGSWWGTTGWEEHTEQLFLILLLSFFSCNIYLVSDWRRHHHHSVSDGVSLHFKIFLPATRAAGRGQRSFYCTSPSIFTLSFNN